MKLSGWRDEDVAQFFAMYQDPAMMELLSGIRSMQEAELPMNSLLYRNYCINFIAYDTMFISIFLRSLL